jgi:translation elongation factor EF-1alpha
MNRTFLLCGQTDSGKSTISANLLCAVGHFDRADIKNGVPSSLLDEVEIIEENVDVRKTKTHEFLFIDFMYKDVSYTLIDTPGHAIYIRSFIEGLFVKKIDLVCLVVSSVDKEFDKGFINGTTKEDLVLARSAGISSLLIIYNKSDLGKLSADRVENLMSYVKMLKFKKVSSISTNIEKDNLEILDYCIIESPVKLLDKKPIVKNRIKVNLTLPPDLLITQNYSCILHSIYGEDTIYIEKIYVDGKAVRFVNYKVTSLVTFVIITSVKAESYDRIILRDQNRTIAFGIFYE